MGTILDTVRENNLAEHTVVFFTSDNGPWLTFDLQGGSAGLLREGKGCTYEGGMREPFLAWWPGTIPAGQTVQDLGCTMDLYTTALKWAGAAIPDDRVIDGQDLTPALLGQGPSPRDDMLYYRGTTLFAVRKGPFKAHFLTQPAYGEGSKQHHPPRPAAALPPGTRPRREVRCRRRSTRTSWPTSSDWPTSTAHRQTRHNQLERRLPKSEI